jgi:hypothetical protein
MSISGDLQVFWLSLSGVTMISLNVDGIASVQAVVTCSWRTCGRVALFCRTLTRAAMMVR